MTKAPPHIKCLDVTYRGSADCVHCTFRKNDIFANIDVIEHEKLLKPITQYDYAKKSVLFVENSPAKSMYIVRKGLVKLEETLNDGSIRIVRIVGEGHIAGLETFIDDGMRYDQTAIALQDTEVCRVTFDVAKSILENDPNFIEAVINEWHLQIEASNKVIVQFSTGSLKQRLACVLLVLIEDANRNSLVEIEMINIDDMAAMTGVTRESVSRTISDFKRKQILTKSSVGKMRFDELALRDIANNDLE